MYRMLSILSSGEIICEAISVHRKDISLNLQSPINDRLFVSYICLPPTLAIFKCRKYFIVTFAFYKDCWSVICQVLLIGIQTITLCYCFIDFVGIISGHFIFAQVSDVSISLKGLRNSWQGQAQIGVSDWQISFIRTLWKDGKLPVGFLCSRTLQPEKAVCGVQQLSWEGSSSSEILSRLKRKELDFL